MLLGCLLALVVVLELANAYFELLVNTQRAALDEDIEQGRAQRGPLARAWLGVRVAFAQLIAAMAFVSLYVHELMHALVQLASGAKPRIVVCKNGGYAEARPWMEGRVYNLLVALGTGLLRGVGGMAPLLGGSTLIYLSVASGASLKPGTLGELGRGIAAAASTGDRLAAIVAAIGQLLAAIAGAPAWAIVLIGLVALVLGWGLTPSSADFHNAAPHLLGYALAYLSAAALLPRVGLLFGVALLGLPLYLALLIRKAPLGLPWLVGGYASSCGLVGLLALAGVLGDDPQQGLAAALGSLLVLLGLAAAAYAGFLALLFALALVNRPSQAFVRRKYGDAKGPGLLASLVMDFETCTRCKMHFRGRCDGCGRTAEQMRAGAA